MRDALTGFGEPASVITLALVLIALIAHEPWRWAGLWLGRSVSVDSEIFIWVRLVSTALVAGLVMRVIVFPAGALESVALGARLFALVFAIAAFLLSRRNLAIGVTGGALALYAAGLVMGS